MSRSRKKYAVLKYRGYGKDTRKLFWKSMRSAENRVLHRLRHEIDAEDHVMFPKKHEVMSSWDYCDFVYVSNWSFNSAKLDDLSEQKRVVNEDDEWRYYEHPFSNRLRYHKYCKK
jgi:hypothetical protein